jgi:hypothetical protein
MAILKRRTLPREDPSPSSFEPFLPPDHFPPPPSPSQWTIPSRQSTVVPTSSAEFGWKQELKQFGSQTEQESHAAAGVVRAIARGVAVRGESTAELREAFPSIHWDIHSDDRRLNPVVREASAGYSPPHGSL